MEAGTGERCGVSATELIVGDEAGDYFVIAWDDLRRYRVPAAWAPAVAALARGAEPAGGDLLGYADASLPATGLALLLEAAAPMGRFRPAIRRLEAWAVLR